MRHSNPETLRLYREFKQNSHCMTCPEHEPVVLEFHHLDPSTKTDSVGNLVHTGVDWATVFREIKKCITVCSNCHKKIHAGLLAV